MNLSCYSTQSSAANWIIYSSSSNIGWNLKLLRFVSGDSLSLFKVEISICGLFWEYLHIEWQAKGLESSATDRLRKILRDGFRVGLHSNKPAVRVNGEIEYGLNMEGTFSDTPLLEHMQCCNYSLDRKRNSLLKGLLPSEKHLWGSIQAPERIVALVSLKRPFSPTGPPIAPLSSSVKVYDQDSEAPSPVGEEPAVVDEPSRPRPSTVTVIHTGTKWRQVPREVSWETTELWDGMTSSQASWFYVVAQLAHPAAFHPSLPNHGRNLRSVASAPFTAAQHRAALLPSLLSHRPGRTEGRCSPGSCLCGSHVQPGSRLSGSLDCKVPR